ncbi:anoctamin-10 isoform X2 [Dunckerocampus dactyliophorus]|uniref:anoctamin-10 isoform X2 n=1 Tax=Dunckerocampus dactyliophorus TaxID=161453 RepID=UPI002404C3E7|nr:anoctamin-10 isoform X2 [Dunckerocampus dactyliophorus]
MSKAGRDDPEKSPGEKPPGAASTGRGWTKVSCPCCVSEAVEPLVLVKLGEKVRPETKRWLIRLIGAPQREGGAALLAHPGEDASGDIIVVSAPRCTLLRATEELGLCKTYCTGEMETFSYEDKDNFRHADNMEVFLTLAERQYMVKYELEGLHAQRDVRIPGLADNYTLQHRDNIWQKMSSAGVVVDTFPLHKRQKLKELSESWYSGNQLSQPLDSVNAYFGSTVGFYFSFLDFYTWSLLPPAIMGLSITYFSRLVVLGMLCFYWGEHQAMRLHEDWDSLVSQTLLYAPSVLHIVYTNVLATVYKTVAQSLTEFENHREESAFQNHLTAKVLVFTFFNYFAVLFHIAFVKQDVPLLRKRLASLLIVTQLVNQVTEVVVPFLVDRFVSAPHRTEREDDPQEDKFRNQITLPVFPGLFAEYIELLVQFGYLSLFSCVYPLTAVLLLINNITEIRTDAYKICKLFRKPFSPPVANMGVWQIAFEILSFIAVVSNCWLLTLSPQLQRMHQGGEMSSANILLLAVLAEHVLVLIKLIMAAVIPDEPEWIRKKRAHIEYTSMQALRQQGLPADES